MKLTKNQSGIAPIAVILLLTLVGIVGFAWWRVSSANKTVRQSKGEESSVQKSNNDNKSPYLGWETFKSPLQKFTFFYPTDWKLEGKSNQVAGYSPDESYTITSKNGVKVNYTLKDYEPSFGVEVNEKAGCGVHAGCNIDVVHSIDKFTAQNKGEILLVKMGVQKKENSEDAIYPAGGNYFYSPGYHMKLHIPEGADTTPKVGENKFNDYMINYLIPGRGKDKILMEVSYPESFYTKSPQEIFALEDSKTAELILRSLRFDN